MTALPDWRSAGRTDAELAGAAADGDRGAFAAIYDRYADRLHDFCVGMLRDPDAAADCVQETFCTAATDLAKLREPEKLRPWLYAIARNEALRRIGNRRREQVSDELPEAASGEAGPETLAARSELAELVAEAAGGLSDRDRAVLELAYRHGLDGLELAEAMGVSHSSAKKMTQRLRDTVERSLGALLVARRARGAPNACPELAAILNGWDGHFNVLMRKRIARHIESCSECEQDRRQLVNPVALLGTVPVFVPAPGWLREQTLNQVRLPGSAAGTAAVPEGDVAHVQFAERPETDATAPAEPADGRRIRGLMLLAALLVGAVLVALGLVIPRWDRPHTAIVPSNVNKTAPAPTSFAPGGPLIATTTPASSPFEVPTASTAATTMPAAPPAPSTTASGQTTAVAPPSPVTGSTPPPDKVPTTPTTATPSGRPPAPPSTSTAPSTVPTGIVPSHGAPRPTKTTGPSTIF